MNVTFVLEIVSALVAGGVALAVMLRSARSPARWLFAAGMTVLAIESTFAGLSAHTNTTTLEAVVFWQRLRLLAMAVLPSTWLAFSLSYSRGNYRDFLWRWRFALVASFLIPVLLVVAFPGGLIAGYREGEPAEGWFLMLGRSGVGLYLIFLVAAVLIIMNLERTFRAAVGTMRWRIKYVVLGLAVLFGGRIYTSSQVLLFSGIDPSLFSINAAALLIACLLIPRSLSRAGVFSVDVYLSHTLLSASLTIVLAALYLLLVGILAKIVSSFGGTASFPLKTFLVFAAFVGLAVLLLSDRVREYSRRFVSRHLSRPRYDYRKVWQTFTERTTSRFAAEDLCRAVVEWLSDTFNVLSTTVWLVEESRKRLIFGASTSLTGPGAKKLADIDTDLTEIIEGVRRNSAPVDIDASPERWAQVLKRITPDHFRAGGSRVCIPIEAGGEFLGLIMLGDRVGGVPFSIEDFELFKCIGDQVGSNLLSLRLSRKLVEAKEMEAFQTMSAFFVHDLKNTAHTLSLMLRNLPAHFDNPAFREDALRAIGKGAQRLNDLITRLSLLRQKPEVNLVPANLNEVVTSALAALEPILKAKLSRSLPPLSKTMVDPEQFQKVVTNLVLNAADAVGEKGEIQIETHERDGWLTLSIKDNGCGMSREFILNSLFRPFQTTKKKGIGIGVYHCKTIVDAHRGRIEVESEEGRGTTMRVLLRVAAEEKQT